MSARPVTHYCSTCARPCACRAGCAAAADCSHCQSVAYVLVEPTMSGEGQLPDTEPLLLYAGKVQVLVPRAAKPIPHTARVLEDIKRRLTHFDSRVDYLASVGGGMLGALLVGVALSDLGVEQVQWLVYQRGTDAAGKRVNRQGHYEVRVLHFGQLDLDMDEHFNDEEA